MTLIRSICYGYIADSIYEIIRKHSKVEEGIIIGLLIQMECKENSTSKGKYDVTQKERRETWTGRFDFFLSNVGYAVGIGNIWRFPYLCYKNGGGSFLIPYITFMILGALPMFLLEYSLGQFSSNGPISVWKICPLMKGLGYAMVITSAIFCIYFNVMMGYVLYFLYHSLTSVLPWSTCDNEWNTEFCYILKPSNTSTSNVSSITGNNTGDLKMSSSEEFWSYNVLQITSGIEDMGNIRLELLLCLFIFWFIVFLCLYKGIKVSGKIVYMTAIFPYIVLIIFLIRVVTLPGATDGILFYVVPQWDKLLSTKVWGEAALQIFYSTSMGWGGLLTFASYNKFHDNMYGNAMIVPAVNCGTSIFAGFITFSTLGFMALNKGTTVDKVLNQGPGLVFITYPEAISSFPISPFWAVLFFLMLFTIGIDTQFGTIETVLSALTDEFPKLFRRRKVLLTGVICLIEFILGIPLVMQIMLLLRIWALLPRLPEGTDYLRAYSSGPNCHLQPIMAVTVSVLANIVGVVGLVVIVIKLVQKVLSHRKWVAVYDALPGESHKKHWLWGHVHLYPGPNEEGLKFQMERVSRFPKLHCLWISFIRPIIVMHHPDTMRAILKTSEPKPRGLGTVYIMGVDWLGEGLLIANGERWARNRRLLTPAFHFDILQPYIKVYNRATDILLEKIEDQSKANKSFELFSNIGLCSLDIILRCAFSYESNCQTLGESHPYVCAVEKLSEIWVDRSLNPVLFPDFIFYLTKTGKEFRKACDYVHTVAEEIIEKRRKTLEVEGLPNKDTGKRTRYLDFLDILITAKDENGEGLTPLEIRNEVDTFLFEGHDTTTSSMCWTLYSISQHPKWQTKIQEEIDHLLKAKKSSEIESEDLPKLESLTLCIKEGMRLHCPVGFISRVTTKEMVIDGVTIPANTTLALQIYNLHHNDTVWENPHEFMPERFLPENSADRDSYAFIPFSAGPRNCIGQHFAMNEQKVVLARLLQKFTFQPDPDCLVKKKIGVVMRAENGIKLFAHPRS